MRQLSLTVLPGDGIGPEVMSAALAVLTATGQRFGFGFRFTHALIGARALSETGRSLPVETLHACRANAAVLLGPVAGGKHVKTVPSNRPREAVLKLRDWLGSYAAVRPIRSFAGLKANLPCHAPFDLVLIFDYSSGLYFGRPRGIVPSAEGYTATNTMVYTTTEVERVFRIACQIALRRQRRILSVDQSKWLETGQLWSSTIEQKALELPNLSVSRRDATHFFFELVNQTSRYDVIVSEMSIGLLAAAVAQGLSGAFAIHPVAYVGGETAVFQPSHGSGPHIAGRGLADPIGMIRAGALALEMAFNEPRAAEAIETAVERTLAEGTMPQELELTCSAATENPQTTCCERLTAAIIRNLPDPVTKNDAPNH